MPGVQHNKKREELHRLQEKYPEQAAKLAKACGTLRRRGQQGCHLFALDGTAVCIALCPTCHRVMLTPCLQAYAPQAVNKVAPLRPVQAADVHSDSGGESSSSEDADDDEGSIPEKTQAQIFETLLRIRQRDQSIYDNKAKFYSSSDNEDEGAPTAASLAAPGAAVRWSECS